MKKTTFIGFVVVEVAFALIAMGLLFSDVGAFIYPISVMIFAAVLTAFCLRIKKETDEAKKRKLRLRMVLIMLIPILAAIAAIGWVVVSLVMYYGF